MNNCLKYANCQNAIFSADLREGQVIIRFADDGKGFDTRAVQNGYGLKNMSSRAEKIGGELEVESKPGDGCRVSLKIPQMR